MAVRRQQFAPSRNISNVLYDSETMTLTVQFLKGGAYEYYEVDESAVLGFGEALSATKYLEAFIANQYPSTRVG